MRSDASEKTALITGITGQDGSYLAEYLIGKGYVVHGIIRRASLFNTDRIDHRFAGPQDPDRRMILHYGDLTDTANLIRIVQEVRPDEIYNLGAQSHVAVSFETPEYTAKLAALGALHLLEAIRIMLEVGPAMEAKDKEQRATRQRVLDVFERAGVKIPKDTKLRD